jgi:hypothetical protein
MSGTAMGDQQDERVDTPGGDPRVEYPADEAKAALTEGRRRGKKRTVRGRKRSKRVALRY